MALIKKFRICLYIVAAFAIPGFAQTDCSKINTPLCEKLKITVSDSTVFSIAIAFLRPPRENFWDTTYWARLKGEVGHFFTTYDIQDSLGNRMPVPDSIDFSYVDIFASKQTIIGFVEEDYIQEVAMWEGNGPAGVIRIPAIRSYKIIGFEREYSVDGRRIAPPFR